MNYIRIIILLLLLCNLPGFLLVYFGPLFGTIASYSTSLLLIFYFLMVKPKNILLIPFVLVGVLYFIFSSFHFSNEDETNFIKNFIRFMVVVICGGAALYRTNRKELVYILLFGALSIVINAIFFPNSYTEFSTISGRASGFYLNPNYAGIVCLAGYSLTYKLKGNMKYLFQLMFTLAGILTFSRTFMLIWLLINIVSVYVDRRNLKGLGIGGAVLILLFSISSFLELNTERFAALESLFSSNQPVRTIKSETRLETWSRHTPIIWENPIFGNGYGTLSSKRHGSGGIHNTYLMVWGEAGIIPFMVLVSLHTFLLIKSLKTFKEYPEYFFLALTIAMAMLASHGYFASFFMVSISMYVYIHLNHTKNLRNDRIT